MRSYESRLPVKNLTFPSLCHFEREFLSFMENIHLKAAIAKAFPGPGRIRVPPGLHRSAITALSVHCLFIQSGFIPQEADETKSGINGFLSLLFNSRPEASKSYRPPDYWLALIPSPEFVFRYTFPGKLGTFMCHCSVKLETEQMFVHVSEEGNTENIQFVGLLVSLFQKAAFSGSFR